MPWSRLMGASSRRSITGDKNFTPHKLKARMQQLEQSIARYLDELDCADREPASVPPQRVAQLKQKIASVKQHIGKLGKIEERLLQTPDQQISLTDPDARSMATSGRGTGIVGSTCRRRWTLSAI